MVNPSHLLSLPGGLPYFISTKQSLPCMQRFDTHVFSPARSGLSRYPEYFGSCSTATFCNRFNNFRWRAGDGKVVALVNVKRLRIPLLVQRTAFGPEDPGFNWDREGGAVLNWERPKSTTDELVRSSRHFAAGKKVTNEVQEKNFCTNIIKDTSEVCRLAATRYWTQCLMCS